MANIASVTQPFSIFLDLEGVALEDGNVYIGAVNTNPLIEANRIAIYADSAFTTPIAQPVKTIAGVMVRSGSPTYVYVNALGYSIVITDKNNRLVYSALSAPQDPTNLSVDWTNIVYTQTAAEIASGKTPVNYYYGTRPFIDAARFGVVANGVADDTVPLQNAIGSLNGLGGTVWWRGTAMVTSTIVLPAGVRLLGDGFSEINATGASARGATCILRFFVGATPTVLASGDDCGLDMIDIDNNLQGTGECVQVTGSRFSGGTYSTRNSGGVGMRIGKTNAGASDTNSNCWKIGFLLTSGNQSHGFLIDDTNTTVSASYPLGLSNANSGVCDLLDARGNVGDGVRFGNCNDNLIAVCHAEGNTGCGARFFTDGVNLGPRCNTLLVNDCEGNTGNDIQIDNATLPVSGPGGYNKIFGNRSVAVNSRIVDNSNGTNFIMQWSAGMFAGGYHFGPNVNTFGKIVGAIVTATFAGTVMTVTAVTSGTLQVGQFLVGTNIPTGITITSLGTGTGGTGTYNISATAGVLGATTVTATFPARFNAHVGPNNAPTSLYAIGVNNADTIIKILLHRVGSGNVDIGEYTEYGVHRTFYNQFVLIYTASMTMDCRQGNSFEVTVNTGAAFTFNAPLNPVVGQQIWLKVRNTSGGVLGVITFNAVFKMPAFTSPATGFSRAIMWEYNGANWVQMFVAAVDVPN